MPATAPVPASLPLAAVPRPGTPRGTAQRGELSPGQLRAVVAAIIGVHAVAGWGLLQISAVREALVEAVPIFVTLFDAPAPPKPPEPLLPPPPPKPQLKKSVPPPPAIVTAAPSPSPAPAVFVAPPPPPVIEPLAPIAPPTPPAPPAIVAAPAPPAPPPPAPPKVIPASAVQYLEQPAPVYPRTSIRLNETGVVTIRVFIGEDGLPKQVQVAKSSGFPRLDDAAVAGVQKARFKPPTENGKPISGWARIDIPFELEK